MKNNKICCPESYEANCPIFDVHDKIEESFYFLVSMGEYYHFPCVFRYNLNAFIQSLRSVTFLIQANKAKIPDFEKWYKIKQDEMKNNNLLSKISSARTFVVHKGMLKTKSKASIGLFRDRDIKLCFDFNINPFVDSKTELLRMIDIFIKNELDFVGNHGAIGEQYGLKRQWVVEDISSEEIVSVCYEAYKIIVDIVFDLHQMFGFEFVPSGLTDHFIEKQQVLLETDIDPSLPKKWGW